MAEETNIAWATSTFNPWIGCTHISEGCTNCYAAALDERRFSRTLDGGTPEHPVIHWGPGAPRHRTSEQYWNQVRNWDKKQAIALERWKAGVGPKPEPWRVFCASLADVFDNEIPLKWRVDLWKLILETPNLSWLLLTKRIGNVRSMVPPAWLLPGRWPAHVRLMISVVNQEEADRDVPKLLAIDCPNGISYEPALGPVNWCRWLFGKCDNGSVPSPGGGATCGRCMGSGCKNPDKISWTIIGGESAQGSTPARPFFIEWARSTIAQCHAAGVPVLMKQLGSNAFGSMSTVEPLRVGLLKMRDAGVTDRAGADHTEWPEDLRVTEFPC